MDHQIENILERKEDIPWSEFLDKMLFFTKNSVKDKPISGLIKEGLEVFLQFPNCKTVTLYSLDEISFDFEYSSSLPHLSRDYSEKLFDELSELGVIAETLESGQLRFWSTDSSSRRQKHFLIVPLIISAGVMGLVIIELYKKVENLEQLLISLSTLHAHQFANLLNNSKNVRKLQSIQSLLEQKIAIRTENIKRSQRELKLILDSVQTGIIIFNKESGEIVDANLIALEKLKMKKEEVLGTSRMNYCPSNKYKKYGNVEAITKSKNCESLLINGEGDKIPIIRTITTVRLGDRDFYLESFLDITERKKAELEILTAKDKAVKSERIKSDFLAQMSHEIRSPVNIILSFSSLIRAELEEQTTEDMVTCFDAIENGGRRLIRTIDLILNMSDMQNGTYDPKHEEINLPEMVLKPLIVEYSSMAKQRGLKLIYKNGIDDARVFADRYTAVQIFANLIDNAIKYTKHGIIEVILSKTTDSNVRVSVVDSGIGISADYLPHLFDAFSQEEEGYTRKFEGTGLGLSLVKKYCEVNKAQIDVKSKKNEGTTFNVTFPIPEFK